MGVKIKAFKDLGPDIYRGSNGFGEHTKLAALFEGKIVAIDGFMFIGQARNSARINSMQDSGNEFSSACKQSMLTLCQERVNQMLRYGAHPVMVLDGKVPDGKEVPASAGYQRSSTELCWLMKQLCESMAVTCVMAPSEGEAMCAALEKLGKVDAVWTQDVVDSFMFGGRTVLRACTEGNSNQQILCYKTPAQSAVATVRRSNIASYLGCAEGEVEDLCTCFSAIVGTDFNKTGLQSYGDKKAQEVVCWIRELWQQKHAALAFDDCMERVISREIQVDAPKNIQTFLQYARHEAKVDFGDAVQFTEQLRDVFRIVRDQRRQAEGEAAKYSREELMWDGSKVQHARFVALLEQYCNTKDKDKNPPVLRVMNLEAERMLRCCESNCSAAARIVSVAKVKDFGKEDKEGSAALDTDGVADALCYQYLVNIELNPAFSGFTGSFPGSQGVKSRLQTYLEDTVQKKTGTWVAGARIARKSDLVKNWPSVVEDWKCKKAGKKRAADTKAKKAAERAQKQQENKAQQGCLDSGFSKVRQPYANECLQQVDQQCQKGVGTSRGLGLPEPNSNHNHKSIPTPPGRPRKSLFASLKTTPKPSSSLDAPPSQHPLSPSQSHSSLQLSHFSDSKFVSPRKPVRCFEECKSAPAAQIDLTSPAKKRAVSPANSPGVQSPVKSSPGGSGTINLLDSPVPLPLQPATVAALPNSCVDLTFDSDSE